MPGSKHIWPQHDIFYILICCGTFASPCHSFYIVPHARMRWKLKCLSQPPIIMSMVVGITDFSCPCSGLTVNDIDGVADFRSRSARKYRNVTKPLFHLQKTPKVLWSQSACGKNSSQLFCACLWGPWQMNSMFLNSHHSLSKSFCLMCK